MMMLLLFSAADQLSPPPYLLHPSLSSPPHVYNLHPVRGRLQPLQHIPSFLPSHALHLLDRSSFFADPIVMLRPVFPFVASTFDDRSRLADANDFASRLCRSYRVGFAEKTELISNLVPQNYSGNVIQSTSFSSEPVFQKPLPASSNIRSSAIAITEAPSETNATTTILTKSESRISIIETVDEVQSALQKPSAFLPKKSRKLLSQLVSSLENAASPAHVLSSDQHLNLSDLNIILHALQSSEKIVALFIWMRHNFATNTSVGIYEMVFKVLSKRQEWNVIDRLLREGVSYASNEASCEMFNQLFRICATLDSPEWASKWFRYMLKEKIQPNADTFELLMPLFRKHKNLKESEFVYRSMIDTGIQGSRSLLTMMRLYWGSSQFDKMKQIFNKAWEIYPKPEVEFFILQLNACVEEGNVNGAEETIKYLLDSGTAISLTAYNLMIRVNGKMGHFKSARAWFHQIEKDGLQPNAASYSYMIGACGRAGKLHEALCYYDGMKSSGFPPSRTNFNTLIHLHRKLDTDGRIFDLLVDMKNSLCSPDSSTLHSLLKVFERYGRYDSIPEALRQLGEAGWSPTAKCYSILLRTYTRCNMVVQAIEAFSNLWSLTEVEENVCHNLICMCKSTGHYDEAIHVFGKMQQSSNFKPSLKTSCTIIDIYSLKGEIEHGEALFEGLRLSQRQLDSVAYNVLLTMYLRGNLLQKAAEALKMVLTDECLKPDLYLFLCMLKVCVKCGLQNEAVDIYWRIMRSNMTLTESLYTGIIHCCGRFLPSMEVSKILDEMIDANIPLNNMTCNVLIDIFGKSCMLERAHFVLRLALKLKVHDGISFSTMIDAYGKNKEFSQMESVLVEMRNHGFKDCQEAYNSMLDAYGMSGQIDKMENTFARMQMAGCTPNLATFNTLLKIYGQEGLVEELESVLKKLKEADIKWDSYTYNTLIFAYGNAQMVDEAMRLFMEMQDAGFVPDLISYNCLISALKQGGQEKQATRLLQWISDAGISLSQ